VKDEYWSNDTKANPTEKREDVITT